MATGTTAEFNLTRNEVVAAALRKIKGWPEDGNPAVSKIRDAIKALNLILRQEDLKGVTINKHLWALDSRAVFLSLGGLIYGSVEGLPSIVDLISVSIRATDGSDSPPLQIITAEEYAALRQKNATGTPEAVYLQRSRLLSDQKLFAWPSPTVIGTTSEVRQDDKMYSCIIGHAASALTKPGVGASWKIYWQVKTEVDVGADTWVTATAYTNGVSLWLSFKRPLFDFVSAYDNPDMPAGWGNYLIYTLALDLAPEYGTSLDDRKWLAAQLAKSTVELFPSSRSNANTYHNKAVFF